jgi:hypothetical protein
MHNLALTVVLTEQRRRQCPCGAVADRPLGLCRKCQDRNARRRRTTSTRRKNTRGRNGRRKVSRLFADVLNGRER